MAHAVETVVTRRLPYPWGLPRLQMLWEGVCAEGYQITRIYLSPADFTCYGNLLTGLQRYVPRDGTVEFLEGRFSTLDMYGKPVIEVPGWPANTIGYVVEVG